MLYVSYTHAEHVRLLRKCSITKLWSVPLVHAIIVKMMETG